MKRTSVALRRFGVGLLSATTIGAGLVAFAGTASATSPISSVAKVVLSPASAALSTEAVYDNGQSYQGGYQHNAGCQWYTAEALDSHGNPVSGTYNLNVILTPSTGVDSWFCGTDSTTQTILSNGASDTGNPGLADQATESDDSSGYFYFGVGEYDSAAVTAQSLVPTGTIGVKAYADIDGNAQAGSSEPAATGTVNIVSSPTEASTTGQDEITDTLSVTPSTQTGTAGVDEEYYMVTAMHGSSLVAGADVYYEIKSSQGNDVNTSPVGTLCDDSEAYTSNGYDDEYPDGQVECGVDVPSTVTGQSGPYTITFYVPHFSCDAGAGQTAGFVSSCDASTTATLNAAALAPANSTVSLTCGTATTDHYAPYYCEDGPSGRTETLTATVLAPASPTAATATIPTAGVVVNLDIDDWEYSEPSVNALSCVTGADGTCTFTITNGTNGPDWTEFYDYIDEVSGLSYTSTDSTDYAPYDDSYTEVDFGGYYTFSSPATNIAAKSASASGVVNQAKLVEFDVTNQYNNPANATCNPDDFDYSEVLALDDCDSAAAYDEYGSNTDGPSSPTIPVTLTVTGGTFSDGTTQAVVNAVNGAAQVSVVSSSAGTATVTANLDPSTTDCSMEAGNASDNTSFYNDVWEEDETARAGNCAAQESISFASGADKLTVSASNGTVGSTNNVSATVKTADGTPAAGVVVSFQVTGADSATGTAATNSSGVAHFAFTPNHAGGVTVSAVASAPGSPNGSKSVSIGKRAEHPTITLSRSGHTVTIHVASHPAVGGATVTFLMKSGGRFHSIGTSSTGPRGKAHKSFSESSGRHTFKVRVGGNASTRAGTSAAKSITV